MKGKIVQSFDIEFVNIKENIFTQYYMWHSRIKENAFDHVFSGYMQVISVENQEICIYLKHTNGALPCYVLKMRILMKLWVVK